MRARLVAFVAVLTAVVATAAADPRDMSPRAMAYTSVDFGSRAVMPAPQLRFGLLVDHDRRYVPPEVPAIFRFDLDAQGQYDASLNGVPFARRIVSANQNGAQVSYSIVDLGLLAIGAVGVGLAVADVADAKDDPDPPREDGGSTTGGDGGNGGGGGTAGGTPLGGTPLGGTPVGGTPLGFVSLPQDRPSLEDLERQIWLDGGDGQMGDLYPVD